MQCAAFAAIVLLGAAPFARALWTPAGGKTAGGAPAESAAPAPFPQRLGSFALRRTWEERLSSGVLLYRWAEYGRADVAQAVTVGISATLGTHDPLLCHMVRGEDWRWHGDLKLLTGDGRRTAFSGTFFEDGVVRTLEVHTLCGAERCGQFTLGHRRSGFILSFASAPGAMLATEPARPIGMLLRAESTDVQSEPETAREQLNLLLADFAAALDPVSLSRVAS